jgi:hypothetical protein
MAYDYTPLVATVARLLAKFGRQVTFRKFGGTLTDPAKPWGSNATLRSAATQTDLWVLSLPPDGLSELGITLTDADLAKSVSEVFIIEPGSVDLSEYQEVADGTQTYRIEFLKELRPGSARLLWYAGVKNT